MAYYLDLFNGNPETSGTSVLLLITGSATRPDITDDLTELPLRPGVVSNLSTLVVSEESENQTNISYVALYDAESGGTLIVAAALGASPTIAKGNPVQFTPLNLVLQVTTTVSLEAALSSTASIAADLTVISSGAFGQWVFNDTTQSGQILSIGL